MTRRMLALFPLIALLSASSLAAVSTDQPVSVSIPSGELHGSLKLPSNVQPRTVALIIAGSGPTDRDGNSPMGKNNSLEMLSEALASGGIASVRYDKRGVAQSTAAATDESKLLFSDLIADAKAWVNQLAADKRFANVVVVGHSEGATIGLLAAQQSKVRAYVSIAGPALSASHTLRSQLQGKLPPYLVQKNEEILLALESGKTVQAVPPALMALYRPSVQPYLIDWFKVVPTEAIRNLGVPCLLVQGDTDIQVPVQSVQALHEANPATEVVIVEGMNHVLKLVPDDQARQIASYQNASLPLAPKLGDSIVRFIRAHEGT